MAKRGTLIQQSRRIPASQKAAWHQITGAGKSHVKRKFFGLSDRDEDVIVKRIDDELAKRLKP